MRVAVLVVVLVGLARGARGQALAALEALLPSALLDNVEELVRAASAACELVPLDALMSRHMKSESAAEPLGVVQYWRGGVRAVRAGRGAARRVRVPRGAVLPLYVPGWGNSPTDEPARALAAALLQHHPTVLVADTRAAFARPYLAAAARVPAVARALHALLQELGVPPARVHLVGFSLGAHAAGGAGRRAARAGAPLGRITALDPARPCFTRSPHRLRREDARFVHAIHSSAGVLGLEEPVGHADLYVNGVAGRQPGCGARGAGGLECDHNEAWRMFVRSARDPRALPARHCHAWRDLARAACTGERALLGYPCDTSARGMFLYKSDT